MQNKGAIRFLLILFTLAFLYHLSFTFVARRMDKKAKEYSSAQTEMQAQVLAAGDEVREKFLYDSIYNVKNQYFIDSVGNKVIYNLGVKKYTYKNCKGRELNLGLDLRGGMNVLMEVSLADVVRALAGHSTDEFFNQVVEEAIIVNRTEPNTNFVDVFDRVWNQKDPNAQMAAIFSFEMKDVNATSTNAEVISAIRKEAASAYDRTYQILRTRIDKFGVAQPNIQPLRTTDRILIELPGVKDPARVRKLLQGTAQLEFWETYEFSELVSSLQEANTYLVSVQNLNAEETAVAEEAVVEETAAPAADEPAPADDDLLAQLGEAASAEAAASADDAVDAEQWRAQNPLFAVLMPTLFRGDEQRKGPVVGYAQAKDMAKVDQMLEQAKSKFPRNVKFVWSVKPIQENTDIYSLIALKVNSRNGQAPLGGDVVTDARQDYGQNGGVEISMSMNTEGARIWKNLTGHNIGRSIAIVLDNVAYSWPTVNGEIPGGRSSITGGFSVEEGQDLANVLKAGKLPAPANIVQEAVVGPSLGQESINHSMISFILAFILVLIYMWIFYKRAGWVANIALLVNVFFLFGALTSLGAVLTLSGIAGIVLTLGMAVDANVIIYERIKEELRIGKSIRMAINDGYKNAYSAIIDGQVTTLLIGIILFFFGTGSVKGFATTLCIGIITSLVTSIFITRLVFMRWIDRDRSISFSHKFSENFLANVKFDFINWRKFAFIVSCSLIVISVASLCIRGLSLGIDFTGGRSYVVRFDQVVSANDVRSALIDAFDGDAPEVKTFGPSNQVKVTTKYRITETGAAVEEDVEHRLYEGCKGFFVKPIEERVFTEDETIGQISSETVGAAVASDITRSAFWAVLGGLLVVFIYIAIRFRRWQFGLAGLAGLAHDTLITIGLFSLFHGVLPFSMDIDQAFIAAILTIIGYSINDTVVIFDRIRENLGLYPKHNLKDNMNDAVNSTLPRTINTSGTTLVTLLMIFIFGGEVIRGFVFCILCGIVIGTYSSVFVASPLAYLLLNRKQKRDAERAKEKGIYSSKTVTE